METDPGQMPDPVDGDPEEGTEGEPSPNEGGSAPLPAAPGTGARQVLRHDEPGKYRPALAVRGGTMDKDRLNELLFQALETERGGIQVYENAVDCAQNDDLHVQTALGAARATRSREDML